MQGEIGDLPVQNTRNSRRKEFTSNGATGATGATYIPRNSARNSIQRELQEQPGDRCKEFKVQGIQTARNSIQQELQEQRRCTRDSLRNSRRKESNRGRGEQPVHNPTGDTGAPGWSHWSDRGDWS